MARKHDLAGLDNTELPAGNSAANGPFALAETSTIFPQLGGRGAIGAVSRSLERLKLNTVHELSPDLIDSSFVADRLELSPENLAELVNSMRVHGQHVPILVRPHPMQDGRYQVAYGHRRLKAAAELGRAVRAVVKALTDDELVIAQGQENSARTDLSFIERARYAAELEGRGYSRETIMAALSVDKTGLSKLISAAVKIPEDVLQAIGPAPKAGRDRWIELSTRLERADAQRAARLVAAADGFSQNSSDERFVRVFRATTPKATKSPRPAVWKSPDGKAVARIRDDDHEVAVMIDKKIAPEFGTYLVEKLPEIYAAFQSGADA